MKSPKPSRSQSPTLSTVLASARFHPVSTGAPSGAPLPWVGMMIPCLSLARRTTMSGCGLPTRLDSSSRPAQPICPAAAYCRISGIWA